VVVAPGTAPSELPPAAFQPVQPADAQHEDALEVVQVRVEVPPEVTEAGAAERVRVGAGGAAVTVTVALLTPLAVPPAFQH